ncbi:hypothetical protein [Hydrocarboniclastica marina]|uniref:Uncharacterized protein n=1 Tax=Hydrocarboniclastica marina TaxID=2259620 RepID=A0A4V1D9B3_9ALTE|nr:hypothetical protein [Hydrocarboniclastica marina]QCF28090.1 hypothetical protein soil367_18630 [Hydrocarboniclastica marina]
MLIEVIGGLSFIAAASHVAVKAIDRRTTQKGIQTARELDQQERVFGTFASFVNDIPRELVPGPVFEYALHQQSRIAEAISRQSPTPMVWEGNLKDARKLERHYRKGKMAPGPNISELSDRDNARQVHDTLLRVSRVIASADTQAAADLGLHLQEMVRIARVRVPAEYHYRRGVKSSCDNLPGEALTHYRLALSCLTAYLEQDKPGWWHDLKDRVEQSSERARSVRSKQPSRLESEVAALTHKNKANLYDEPPALKLTAEETSS